VHDLGGKKAGGVLGTLDPLAVALVNIVIGELLGHLLRNLRIRILKRILSMLGVSCVSARSRTVWSLRNDQTMWRHMYEP